MTKKEIVVMLEVSIAVIAVAAALYIPPVVWVLAVIVSAVLSLYIVMVER